MLNTYVLITPVRNEETYIEKTIQSVISQTILPKKWIIVSDGSTDRTDEIVKRYETNYDWIELVGMPEHKDHNFASKVMCFNAGYRRLKDENYDYIGNLDGDVSFNEGYFQFILEKFIEFPNLGVAGTPYIEDTHDISKRRFYDLQHVHGLCQLFRRKCFEEIGGFLPIKLGGVDLVAVTMARIHGWQTRSFTEKIIFHHRPIFSVGNNILAVKFKYGQKDYILGNHPLWELFRATFQMKMKPYVLGGMLILCGYLWAFLKREKRPVSLEFIKFRRHEQIQRLISL